MPTFDYGAHFGRIKEIERLLLHKHEIQWTAAYAKPESPVDVLLYLGCNVLQTAHLACEVVNVFKCLGVNFHAVGGPQFCCGIVHHRNRDLAPATSLARATVTKFASDGAPQVVMWCPSCHLHFHEAIRKDLAPSFSVTHATAFLAERAAQLPFRQPVPVRAAVHTHTGRPQQDRDAEAALTLLGAVPGVRVMGTIAAPELSYQCGIPMSEAARAVSGPPRPAARESPGPRGGHPRHALSWVSARVVREGVGDPRGAELHLAGGRGPGLPPGGSLQGLQAIG